jgi:teichuronic acid biosynthesis glycosyltransferase TuaC
MRVLVLSSVFPNPRRPTLGVFVRERTRRIARRCELRVVAPVPWFPFNELVRGTAWSGIPRDEEQGGLRVHHPRFFCVPRYLKWLDAGLYAASLLPFLIRLRRRFPFGLIDAHFAYPDGAAAVLLGRIFRVPVGVTLRGSIVRLATYALHRPQLRWTLGHADRVLAVSQSLASVAAGFGIDGGNIRVVPNGVDADLFHPADRARARAACGLPAHRTVLLAVGGVYDGKGHHLMVDALAALVRRRPDLLYVVVGGEQPGDPYRRNLERQIDASGLRQHVHFAGPRPHHELPRWYAAADLFCLATRSEGWANALLEAIATGLPVVTTNVGGNREIVRDGQDGLLVPFGDAAALVSSIDLALDRDWDRDAMVAYAARHTWDRAAAAVLEEFRHLVHGSTPRATAAAMVGRLPRGGQ